MALGYIHVSKQYTVHTNKYQKNVGTTYTSNVKGSTVKQEAGGYFLTQHGREYTESYTA